MYDPLYVCDHVLGAAGQDLCDCDFSLAYGGRILLSNATLRLKVGSRYGLCGPNGAGKTTLMKAIANGQVCTPAAWLPPVLHQAGSLSCFSCSCGLRPFGTDLDIGWRCDDRECGGQLWWCR